MCRYCGGDTVEGFGIHAVVGPFAALVAADQAPVDQQLHVMRHRGLGQPSGSVRSQMQASPPSDAAMRDTSLSHAGSASALNNEARRSAATVRTPVEAAAVAHTADQAAKLACELGMESLQSVHGDLG